MNRIRTVAVATGVLLSAGALASCGVSSTEIDAARARPAAESQAAGSQAVLASVRQAAAARTATYTLTTEVGTGPAIAVTGAYDLDAGRAEASTRVSGSGRGGVSVDTVADGTTVYVKAEALSNLLGADRPWLKLDLDRLARNLGRSQGLGGADPLSGALSPTDANALLDQLRELGAPVTQSGTDTIDGVQATHYQGTIDLAAAEQKLDPEAQQRLDRLFSSLSIDRSKVLTQVPVDLWVGPDGQLRRARLSYQLPDGQSATVTADLTDLGQPVDIAVPPADQVTDIADVPGIGLLFGN